IGSVPTAAGLRNWGYKPVTPGASCHGKTPRWGSNVPHSLGYSCGGIMDKKLFSHLILGFGLLLSLLPIKAWADFTIEFTDGHQVTVGRYVDEGQTIKIYTPQGTIGFRKADVKRITEVDANQSASRRLETVTNRSSSPTQASVQDPSEGKETAEASGKTNEPGQEKAAAAGAATEAAVTQVYAQSKNIATQI